MAATPPAIHRYGRSMAGRVQALAVIVNDTYGGHAERVWNEASSGADLLDPGGGAARLRQAEGADLRRPAGQQLGVRPEGWEHAVGDYAEEGYRSVADVTDPASRQKVRDYKKAKKAAGTAKAV